MPGPKTAGNPNLLTRSVAGAAQLLELWESGRCVLEPHEVRHYVSMLQNLDDVSRECYAYHFGADLDEDRENAKCDDFVEASDRGGARGRA